VFPLGLEARLIAGAVLCAALIGGAWALASHFEGIGAAKVQAQWDVAKAAQVSVDAAQNAKNRALEQDAATARQEAADARAATQVQVASTRAAFIADAGRLRSTLADSLSGRGATEDSLTACQQRAAAAGNLLGQGLQVQADLAGDAESLAADVRAVLDPKYTAAVAAALNAASAPSK
jgi:hypothetical protein